MTRVRMQKAGLSLESAACGSPPQAPRVVGDALLPAAMALWPGSERRPPETCGGTCWPPATTSVNILPGNPHPHPHPLSTF